MDEGLTPAEFLNEMVRLQNQLLDNSQRFYTVTSTDKLKIVLAVYRKALEELEAVKTNY